MVYVELEAVLPQDMFHLHIGAKQHLAAGAHRAVVNVPSDSCITRSVGAQAIVSEYELSHPQQRLGKGRPHIPDCDLAIRS